MQREDLARGVPNVEHKQMDDQICAQEHDDPSWRRIEPIEAGLSHHPHVSRPTQSTPRRASSITASAAFGPRKTSSISLTLPSKSSVRMPGRSTITAAGSAKIHLHLPEQPVLHCGRRRAGLAGLPGGDRRQHSGQALLSVQFHCGSLYRQVVLLDLDAPQLAPAPLTFRKMPRGPPAAVCAGFAIAKGN